MEAVPLNTSFYKEALIVLGAAGIVIPLFHRLHVSPVLGFMLVGVAVGPFGLASFAPYLPWLSAITISEPESIEPIAHLGVVLLLFMIGLELSFERLKVMRRLVFGLGFLQVVLCAAVLGGAAALLGNGRISAAVIGLALAMSSTAVVIQVLSEEKRLNTATGRASFAILLFQDLAVVPVLLVLAALGPTKHAGSVAGFGLAVGQALLAIAAIVALGRLVLRPLFRSVARTRSPELFVAACLLVVIAAGLATAAAGLSMALGALIGGLLLAGTEYRRQVEVTIEPFKGLLVGVFLISVGMSLDIRAAGTAPVLVFCGAGGMVLLKVLVVAPLTRAFGLSWANGLRTSLLLGPGGEFAFVIVSVAIGEGLLASNTASVVLFVTALTMATIPLLSQLGDRLAPHLAPKTPVDPAILVPEFSDAPPRVILAGFGRVGQTVAAMLEVHQVPYVAIDRDPDRVARQRARDAPVYFGDMTQIELLRRLRLDTARALVVTLDDPAAADELVAGARAERTDLLIVARARDAAHAAHLYRTGASHAVPETIEASLQLSEAVLVDVGVPMGRVIASIHDKRDELQAAIKAMAPDAEVRMLGRSRLREASGLVLAMALGLGLCGPPASADEPDYAAQRAEMVRVIQNYAHQPGSAVAGGHPAPQVLGVMGTVPRHEFVPDRIKAEAYADRPLPIGLGQTISQPFIVAIMTDLLHIGKDAAVLEIGTGSGYQAAVLARLVRRVYTIEIIPALAEGAAERLRRLGYNNIETRVGDGYYGWEEAAPFDGIVVTAAATGIPPPLLRQLKPGGRMVIPVGAPFALQYLTLVELDAERRATTRQLLPVAFVPLTGRR